MMYKLFKNNCLLFKRLKTTLTTHNNPVIISSNKDIYTNLALEHWLYKNVKFDSPIVLIWTDEPCIVFGRHQNPWTEINLGVAYRNGFNIARRHSGGGCVFHDENNINISIIGHRSIFEKRQDNLKFISKVFLDNYGIKCEPTPRHDLIHSDTGFKISGSAAKLGPQNCYHHFTVLVNADKDAMSSALRQKPQDFITSTATQSTRSKVTNLSDINPKLDVNQVIDDLSKAYSNYYKPRSIEFTANSAEEIQQIRNELTSWQWIYGLTPKFNLTRENLTVTINKGLIDNIIIDGDQQLKENVVRLLNPLFGAPFVYRDVMVSIAKLLDKGSDNFGIEQLYAAYLLQIVQDAFN